MMLGCKFKCESILRVTCNQVLCSFVVTGSHTLGMKTCSARFLIVVLHFRSWEGCGSSVNYISADKIWGCGLNQC